MGSDGDSWSTKPTTDALLVVGVGDGDVWM